MCAPVLAAASRACISTSSTSPLFRCLPRGFSAACRAPPVPPLRPLPFHPQLHCARSSSSLLLRWHPFSSSSSPLSSSAPLLPGALLPPSSSSSASATSRKPLSTSAMAATQTPAVVVYVTVPDKAAGQKLAHSIIENKLAACVNRVPGLESTYIWEGKVESSSEEMLIIKTRQTLLDALSEHVKANHPYSLPEFIALPIVGGSEPYLNWIMENTKDRAQ